MMKSRIRIDVVIDVVCPWCYIGKHRLERALKALKDEIEHDVFYHPFELNPSLPAEGVNHDEFLSRKFGGKEQYRVMRERITQVARQENLEFDLERQNILPNTRKAHALIGLAGKHGVQAGLIDYLFRAYFVEGLDLSKEENLIRLAEKAGLPGAMAENVLTDANEFVRVAHDEEKLYGLGITGVPFYIAEDKYGISGAQPAQTFVEAFRQIARQTLSGHPA